MTFFLILLAFWQIMAHAPVQDLICTNADKALEIRTKGEQALIKLPQDRKASIWNLPKSHDQWDAKNKQIFDTYDFEKNKFKVTLKVPETKGSIQAPFVLFENKKFKCTEMKKK